jgi:hypothetical protein
LGRSTQPVGHLPDSTLAVFLLIRRVSKSS